MKKTVYINANIYNGKEDMALQEKASIYIEDNIIKKVGYFDIPAGAKVVDLKGKYVIPGLINAHVHLAGSGKAKKLGGDTKKLVKLITDHKILHPLGIKMGQAGAKNELMGGVTTLRAVGGVADFDTKLRDKINAGKMVGSRLLVCNTAICTEHGHMEGTVSKAVYSIEEAKEAVRNLANEKVDWIKLMITGGVLDAEELGKPGIMKMPPEYVKACCDEAHKLGFKVAAHVESEMGVKVALENGVDTIEHGSELNDELVKLFKERNAAFICTFSPAVPIPFVSSEYTQFDDFVKYNSSVIGINTINGIKSCLENGIMVGLGTDSGCPFTTQYNFYYEMVFLSELCNISTIKTLYFATLGNAKILNIDDKVGSIEEGKLADLVVCDNDPTKDLRNLKNLYLVMKDGKAYKNPKPKRFKDVDEFLESLSTKEIYKHLTTFRNQA